MISIKYTFKEVNQGAVSIFHKVFTIYEVENGEVESFVNVRRSNKQIFDHTYYILIQARETHNDSN